MRGKFKVKKIKGPLSKKVAQGLRAGDQILFSGVFYTARDQAHKKLTELIKGNKKLPLNPAGKIIYYCGPTETPKGKIIGSCGPTTSSRMDKFTEPLLQKGLSAMVGKGQRSNAMQKLISKYKAVYFLAPAGCGALLASAVTGRKIVAFEDFGPEAIYCLNVEKFPLIVGVDVKGRSL